MIFGLFPNLTKSDTFDFLPELVHILDEKGVSWVLTDREKEGLQKHGLFMDDSVYKDDPWIGTHADVVLSLGGDGSFLAVASRMGDYPVHQAGIHLGDFGFLNSITKDDLAERIDDILKGNYHLEKRMSLAAVIERKNGETVKLPYALNDIVAGHDHIGTMVRLDLSIQDTYVQRYAADGLIVSTPTGSTSYSLSCGGPVLHSSSTELLIVPICAHMMVSPPLVVPDGYSVRITVPEREKLIHVCVDGTAPFHLNAGDSLVLHGCQRRIDFIRFNDQDFFVTLAKKFSRV
jgi:NAD+ kinase